MCGADAGSLPMNYQSLLQANIAKERALHDLIARISAVTPDVANMAHKRQSRPHIRQSRSGEYAHVRQHVSYANMEHINRALHVLIARISAVPFFFFITLEPRG